MNFGLSFVLHSYSSLHDHHKMSERVCSCGRVGKCGHMYILCVCVCVLAVCLEKVRFWCLFISGSNSVVLILETTQLSLVIEPVCTLLGL